MSRVKSPAAYKNPPRLRVVRLFLITIFLVGGWLYASRDNLKNYYSIQNERNEERLRIESLKQRLSTLNHRRQSLQLNGVEMERQIRKHHNMHHPGEQVLLIQDARTTQAASPKATIQAPEKP